MITKRFLAKPWLSILGVFLPVGMLCTLATGAARSSMQAAVITLDAGTHYQTITGWEATTYAGQDETVGKYCRELGEFIE
jgi:hypothetical protein